MPRRVEQIPAAPGICQWTPAETEGRKGGSIVGKKDCPHMVPNGEIISVMCMAFIKMLLFSLAIKRVIFSQCMYISGSIIELSA